MKTKKFIQKLEDFGFFTNIDRGVIIVKNKNGNGLAALSENDKYSLDTLFNPAFENLRDNEQKELFDLLVEYTRTPIEEREEEKEWGDESNKINEKIAKLEDLIDELEEMSWNRKEYKVVGIRSKIAEIFEEIKEIQNEQSGTKKTEAGDDERRSHQYQEERHHKDQAGCNGRSGPEGLRDDALYLRHRAPGQMGLREKKARSIL